MAGKMDYNTWSTNILTSTLHLRKMKMMCASTVYSCVGVKRKKGFLNTSAIIIPIPIISHVRNVTKVSRPPLVSLITASYVANAGEVRINKIIKKISKSGNMDPVMVKMSMKIKMKKQ